jgi:hypothetical protein
VVEGVDVCPDMRPDASARKASPLKILIRFATPFFCFPLGFCLESFSITCNLAVEPVTTGKNPSAKGLGRNLNCRGSGWLAGTMRDTDHRAWSLLPILLIRGAE